MTLIRLIAAHLRPYRPWLLAVAVFQLVSVIANLVLPSINAKIIDLGVTPGDTGYIWRMGAIMLGITLIQMVAAGGATYFAARSSMAFGRDTRRSLFGAVSRFSGREVSKFGAASLITRTTNDVQQVQMLVLMTGAIMVSAPMMMIGGVIMALREDAGLSWLIVAVVVLLGSVVVLGAPSFLTLLVPLMAIVLLLLLVYGQTVTRRTSLPWAAALVQAIPLAYLVTTTFPLVS